MNRISNSVNLRNILAWCLIFVVFVASSTVALALPENKSATGELIVSGHDTVGNAPFAMLNGERASSGRTFFSASTIATSAENGAIVKLGKLGSISLTPNTILSLSFGDNKISGNLIAGKINVNSSEGVEVKMQVAGKIVSNDVVQNSVLTVDAQNNAALSDTGNDLINGDNAALPAQATTQTTTTDDNSYVGPLLVFSGIVAVAAIYVVTHRNDDTVTVLSPTR